MITFISGALAAAAVGVTVWLVIGVIKMTKQVKQLEKQKEQLWLEIQGRCDSIERELNIVVSKANDRIDTSMSYTDSRLDKLVNVIERDYITKKNRADNTIEYNN
jgi:hypothetical protein